MGQTERREKEKGGAGSWEEVEVRNHRVLGKDTSRERQLRQVFKPPEALFCTLLDIDSVQFPHPGTSPPIN